MDELLPKEQVTDILNDTFIKQVAALSSTGASQNKIASELKISKYWVKKALDTDRCAQLIAEIGSDAVESAKTYLRVEIGKLSKESVRVIAANLKKDNLEAAKMVLKVAGLDGKENDANTGQQGLTLVLASEMKPPDIVVKE